MRLVLHPAALAELVEAAGFYEAQATGLGLDFFHEVERILRILEDDPEVASVFDPPYRRYLCRRFPFAVVYRIVEEEVRALAVMHQRRRPGYWKSRG